MNQNEAEGDARNDAL